MSAALQHAVQVVSFGECWSCGAPVYGPSYKHEQCRRDKSNNFFCINGHSAVYREDETDRLKKLVESERNGAELARRQRDQERQRAEAAEKKLRRVSNGVCPECKRSFANLARHMKSKHGECSHAR